MNPPKRLKWILQASVLTLATAGCSVPDTQISTSATNSPTSTKATNSPTTSSTSNSNTTTAEKLRGPAKGSAVNSLPLSKLFVGGPTDHTKFTKTAIVALGGTTKRWKIGRPRGWRNEPALEGMMRIAKPGANGRTAIVHFADQSAGIAAASHILKHGFYMVAKVKWGKPVDGQVGAKGFNASLRRSTGSYGGKPADFWMIRFKDKGVKGALIGVMLQKNASAQSRREMIDAVRSVTHR